VSSCKLNSVTSSCQKLRTLKYLSGGFLKPQETPALHLMMFVCISQVVRASPHNQEVMSSSPGLATLVLLLFPWARNFTHIAPVYPAVKWGPGGLVPTGEAAHPAVTSMGTWGSKCQTAVHVSLMGEVQVELWMPTPSSWGMAQCHLQGISPPPGGFASTGS